MTFKHFILYLFSSCCVFYNSIIVAGYAPNVWDVLREQLVLNHEVNHPEVQAQLRWLMAHPGYLQKLTQSEPYIYHIVTEVRKRGLPGELALLPMQESAYNPFAYSVVGAAGLWQLMPGTGDHLGLKQDWWYDGRRSIPSSTNAALNYLTHLYKYFNGDWLLAIAAYDAGEGTISRAVKNSGLNRRVSFWQLSVPNETRAYVPRLLALAEIIKYPDRYRVTLPPIAHVPYFQEVDVGSQIDLNHAAKLAGISYTDLIRLNPGFNRWATAPNQPFKLLIPADKVASFTRNLVHVPQDKRVSWQTHQVRSGESLDNIAQHYFTTAKLIRELNQLKSDKLIIGQSILIPSSKNAPQVVRQTPVKIIDRPITYQTYKVIHIVQIGENLEALTKKYNISLDKIRLWNPTLAEKDPISGDQLIIWRNKITPGIYTIQAGDNLGIIAKKYNTTVGVLQKLNPALTKGLLKPGQQLIIG